MLIPKSSALFWTIGDWWDMPISIPCVHEHAPLSCPNPSWSLFAFPEDPRFRESQGILVQSFSRPPKKFFSQRLGRASFFLFLSFLRLKAYSFMGLGLLLLILSGPLLADWTLPFFKALLGFRFQYLWCFGPQHNTYDILDLNNSKKNK